MRHINRCLNAQLSTICQKAMHLEVLNSTLKKLLPENLREHCHAGSFNKGCLLIIANDANWASQLRFYVPELRDRLRKEAGLYQLCSIKIELNSTIAPLKSRVVLKTAPSLSDSARDVITREIENAPDDSLRQAWINLIQR